MILPLRLIPLLFGEIWYNICGADIIPWRMPVSAFTAEIGVMSPYPIDEKFKAFGFHVINIDGHDFDQIESAYNEARTVKGKPTAIIAKTVKGKGVSFMENKASWHGTAPNDEQYEVAMNELQEQLAGLTK